MASGFMQGMRLGAGLVGLGYGFYRMSQGKRDWMTRTALTAGASLTLAGIGMNRTRRMTKQIGSLVSTMNASMPRFRRQMMQNAPQMMQNSPQMMQNAPQMMANAGSAVMNMLH